MALQLRAATCKPSCVPRQQLSRNRANMCTASWPGRGLKTAKTTKMTPRQQAPQQDSQEAVMPLVTSTCGLLASVASAVLLLSAPAQATEGRDWAVSNHQPPAVTAHLSSSSQCQQQLAEAPDLTSPAAPLLQHQQLQPASHQFNPAAEVARVGEDRGPHWLLHVLFIGVLNILGLWGVLKLIAWAKDNSTPVSVVKLHMGLRVNDSKLQERLHFLRQMMSVEHGMFVTMEETIQICCNPPRGAQLAYADVQVSQLRSKHEGYDLFKQYAAVEQRVAAMEEASHVVHGNKPEGPHHRSALERLMGAAETQDAEESQACVVVTLVMLARGHITIPEVAIRDKAAFKNTMKQLYGHLNSGQLLAVELLLTPDREEDFLSEAMLIEDYPFLIDLKTGQPISTVARKLPPQQQGRGEAAAGLAA